MRTAEIASPRVAVCVELHESNRSVMLVNGAQDRKQNRVIAADAYWAGSSAQHGIELLGDALVGVFNRERVDGEVAKIPDSPLLEGVDLKDRIPGADHSRLHANVAWPEAWAGAIGCASIEWHSDQRDVEFFCSGNMGQPHEGGNAGESWINQRVHRLGMRGCTFFRFHRGAAL